MGKGLKKSLATALAFLTLYALGLAQDASFINKIDEQDINLQMEKIYRVLQITQNNYVEEIDLNKLATAAIKAALGELDPHSIYLPPKKLKRETEKFKGSFDGIGVQYSVVEDTITIVAPIAGGPSEKLGIMAGDKIVKIDGDDCIGWDNDSIQSRLRGPKGTKVEVDIYREGEPELLHFEIIRDKIPLYSVDAAFIIDGTDVGFVSINRFMAKTHEELLDSLRELTKKGMKKLILDLRGNPGGYLRQAFLVADEFIPKGHKIVYTIGRKKAFNSTYYSRENGIYEKIPLILLIDAGSASASEIVSGAIQDLDRGLIVGTTSFGKGLVQRQYRLPDKSAFRITIAKYYTPSGRCIQRPYKDKKKYRSLAGRLDLKEGANINHQLEELKLKTEKDSLPPIYKTLMGRNVLGGGGITPDYIVKYDTITKLSRTIRSKNLFFIFSREYLNKNKENFERNYENDFAKYLREFDFTDDDWRDFKKLVESKKIEWNEKEFEKDKKYLTAAIKSNIARQFWGTNGSTEAFLPLDKQVQKAIELMPEAEEMLEKLEEYERERGN